MNVVPAGALLWQMMVWVIIAIGLAVAATYFMRPQVRARFPGGPGRYLQALIVQASGFMVPIPVVLILLIGAPYYLDLVLAVAAGFAVVALLRMLPVTGPLLRDLAKVRLALALERLGGKP